MEEIVTENLNRKPIFKSLPITCPWVSGQPYPSTHLIKNKLKDFVKKYGPFINNNSKKCAVSQRFSSSTSASPNDDLSSTHFFYFLRLMQLFPETHPATLHTVLTLSKNNFFFAIDKLLYAQKCKSEFSRKLNSSSSRGRGYASRGRQVFPRSIPGERYQPTPRTVSNLAEVQRIMDMAEKTYMNNQTMPINVPNDNQQLTNGMVNICVENPDQLVHSTQTFVETENHEMIEIVCFDNNQNILHQNDDNSNEDMIIETYTENVENIEPSINKTMNMAKIEEENEPPVIVVDTMHESEENDCLNKGHLVEAHILNDLNSADLTNNHPISEEVGEIAIPTTII